MVFMFNAFGVILIILCGLFAWVAAIDPLDSHKAYTKATNEKEKIDLKSKFKKKARKNAVVYIFFILFVVGYAIYAKTALAYEFTEAYHSIENKEVLFSVRIDSVEKEKGKEPIYHITLSDENDPHFLKLSESFNFLSDKIDGRGYHAWELLLTMTETEYETIIGQGNNKFRTEVSILSLKTESFGLVLGHEVTLYRFEGLFGVKFTERDAEVLGEAFLKHVNTNRCSGCFATGKDADFAVGCGV